MSDVGGGDAPTEVTGGVGPAATALTAGAVLRQAREQQGMDLAALATLLKVPVRKLEALEADRFDELPGATFVRALALTACRGLKLDPAEVIAKLPQAASSTLDNVTGGLNQVYQDPSDGRYFPGALSQHRGVLLVMGALLLGAAVLWMAPADWLSRVGGRTSDLTVVSGASAAGSAGSATSEAASAISGLSHVAASVAMSASAAGVVPPVVVSSATGAGSANASVTPMNASGVAGVSKVAAAPSAVSAITAASGPVAGGATLAAGRGFPLEIRVREASWVEVIESGSGQILLGRLLSANESVNLESSGSVRLKVGNARVTLVNWRGQAVDLTMVTKDNVARMELK